MDDIRRFETHLTPARAETEEVLVRLLEEVAALDIEFASELHLARTEFGVSVNVLRSDGLTVALIVGDNEFHGVEDSADTGSGLFEALADGMLEEADINHTLHLGVSDTVDESTDSLSGVATTTQTADGRHTGVVPTAHEPLFDELEHLALRHHGVGDIQPVELILVRAVVALHKLVKEIVV